MEMREREERKRRGRGERGREGERTRVLNGVVIAFRFSDDPIGCLED